MAVKVVWTKKASAQFDKLPLTIRARFRDKAKELEKYPDVSSFKHLRGKLKGHGSVRVGVWRMIFRIERDKAETVLITIIEFGNRSDVYEEG